MIFGIICFFLQSTRLQYTYSHLYIAVAKLAHKFAHGTYFVARCYYQLVTGLPISLRFTSQIQVMVPSYDCSDSSEVFIVIMEKET